MHEPLPKRKHPRLKSYDYSNAGAYFITICAYQKNCLFGTFGCDSDHSELILSQYGKIAEQQLLALSSRYPGLSVDYYVIMPNHIHAIFVLDGKSAGASHRPAVTDIVCAFKSLTTRECKQFKEIDRIFQTSFYEHIIRNQDDYDEVVKYIIENPLKWQMDKLYRE